MHVVGVYVLQRLAGARAAAVSFQLEGCMGTEKAAFSATDTEWKSSGFVTCLVSQHRKSSPVFPFSHQLEQPKIYKGGICVFVCVSSVWSFRTFSINIHLMSLDQCNSLKQRFSENFGKEDHWLIMSKWLDSSGVEALPISEHWLFF